MTEVADLYVKLRATAAGFTSEMKSAEHASLGFDGTMGKTIAGLTKFGFGIAATGAIVAGISVKMGMDFQASMELIRTQAGASQAEVDSMSKAVLGLAGPTATAPLELSKALYHIESTGMRGARALQEMTIAAQGAKVGQADLESVTNALNAAVASGIPGVGNMGQAMGALNATVGAGDMRMQDLAQALGSGVLAVVKGFGVTLNDVGATLATFGDNNIRGADAATMLRMAVEAFAKPAKTGAAALKELGLSQDTLAKDMQTGGLSKALTDIHERLVATGNAGVKSGALLTDAFGKRAGPGVQVLISQFTRFQAKQEEVRRGASAFSSDWAATTQTFAFRVQQIQARVEAWGTAIGLFLIPWVEKAMDAIAAITGWLQKHQAVAAALAAVLGVVLVGALVAAAGAAIAWAVSMVAVSTTVAVAFDEMTGAATAFDTVMSINPVVAVVVGVMALVGALVYAYQHFTVFRNVVNGVWEWIKSATGSVIGWWTANWPHIWKTIQDIWGKVVHTVKTAVDDVSTWIQSWLGPFVGWWQDHWGEIQTIAESVWAAIVMVVKVAWAILSGWFSIVFPILAGIFKAGWDVISGVVKVTWDLIVGVVKVAWDLISGVIRIAWAIIQGIFETALAVLTGHWGDAWHSIVHMFSTIFGTIVDAGANIIHAVWDAISSAVSNFGSLLWNAGVDLINGLIGGVKSMLGAVGDVAKNIGSSIVDGVKGILHINSPSRVFHNIGLGITEGMVNGITAGHGRAVAAAQRLATGVAIAGSGTFGSGRTSYLAGAGSSGIVSTPGGQSVGGNTYITNNVTAQTNADAHQIAAEIGWQLRISA